MPESALPVRGATGSRSRPARSRGRAASARSVLRNAPPAPFASARRTIASVSGGATRRPSRAAAARRTGCATPSRPRSEHRTAAGPTASRRGERRARRRRCARRRSTRPAAARATCRTPCPRTSPGCVSAPAVGASVSAGSRIFARPKSRTFTRPSRVTKTFSGFTSRWTIPFACAAPSPRATCAAVSSASRGAKPPAPEALAQRLALEQLVDDVPDRAVPAPRRTPPRCSGGSAPPPRAPRARSARDARRRRRRRPGAPSARRRGRAAGPGRGRRLPSRPRRGPTRSRRARASTRTKAPWTDRSLMPRRRVRRVFSARPAARRLAADAAAARAGPCRTPASAGHSCDRKSGIDSV